MFDPKSESSKFGSFNQRLEIWTAAGCSSQLFSSGRRHGHRHRSTAWGVVLDAQGVRKWLSFVGKQRPACWSKYAVHQKAVGSWNLLTLSKGCTHHQEPIYVHNHIPLWLFASQLKRNHSELFPIPAWYKPEASSWPPNNGFKAQTVSPSQPTATWSLFSSKAWNAYQITC